MGFLCVINGCSSNSGRDTNLGFFKLPKPFHKKPSLNKLSVKRYNAWKKAINIAVLPKHVFVCGKHFITSKYN